MGVQVLGGSKTIIKTTDGSIKTKVEPIMTDDAGVNVETGKYIYGDLYPTTGNIDVSELADQLAGKLKSVEGLSKRNISPVEVDIKREIAIGKADINGVKSEEIKGKVMNKKDKLKALRRRNKK